MSRESALPRTGPLQLLERSAAVYTCKVVDDQNSRAATDIHHGYCCLDS